MLTIFKYPIPSEDYFRLQLPPNAKILTIQTQYGEPYIWALVSTDTSEPDEWRHFRLAGTGHPIRVSSREQLAYIGTTHLLDGNLVFHLFEILPLEPLQIEAGSNKP